jgi:hypothetical protein
MISVSKDGEGPFVPYEGSLGIDNDDEGRAYYHVRAYAEDEFGNRSPEMQAMEILVDRSSVYVAQEGRIGASGSPDDPFKTLDEAIEAAQAKGKKFVYVRGIVELRQTESIRGHLQIQGGFDGNWRESPAIIPTVMVNVVSAPGIEALILEDGALTISSIGMVLSGQGSITLIKAVGGALRLVDASLQLSGGTELTAINSIGADVKIDRSSISLGRTVTGRGVEIHKANLSIDGLVLTSTSTVRLLDAIRIIGSNAAISNFRLDASPEYAISGLTASGSSVVIDRSYLKVSGGTSSCRLFNNEDTRMSLSSSYIDISWKGTVELISSRNESVLNAAHITAFVDAPRATLLMVSNSTISLGNSIANFTGAVSTLLQTSTEPLPGSITANCFWGFSKLIEGAVHADSMSGLNVYAVPGHPNFIEEPSTTFTGPVKGLLRLSRSSMCIDAGANLGAVSSKDLFDAARPSTRGLRKPDVGAEEFN